MPINYERKSELSHKLNFELASVTFDDCLEYMRFEADETLEAGGTPRDPLEFMQPSDLDQFKQALDWWPKGEDVPALAQAPNLSAMLHSYGRSFGNAPLDTFMERLLERANRASVWSQQAGRDPAKPNETEAERKARKNRQYQADHRQRKSALQNPDTPEGAHALAVTQAHEAYLEVCRQRKQVEAEWAAKVQAAYQHWQDVKKNPPG